MGKRALEEKEEEEEEEEGVETTATTPSKKKKKESISNSNGKTYEERVLAINVICKPLADKKSTKKLHKLVKKSTKHMIRRGVKEVVKGIRKGERGLAILAGDIFPIDVVSHLPVLLEEANVPYLFVPSKQDLGLAANTKRPTSCVLIKDPRTSTKGAAAFDALDIYDAMLEQAKEYDPR